MIKLIMSVESVMNVGFEQIYVMTNNAVKNSTNVIGLYSYNSIREGRNFGVTTAMNFVEAGMGFLMELAFLKPRDLIKVLVKPAAAFVFFKVRHVQDERFSEQQVLIDE